MTKNDGSISIGLELQSDKFKKDLKSIQSDLNKLSNLINNELGDIDLGIDVKDFNKSLSDVSRGIDSILTDIGDVNSESFRGITGSLNELNSTVEDVSDSLSNLSVEDITLSVDTNTAERAIDDIIESLRGISDTTASLNVDTNIDSVIGDANRLDSTIDGISDAQINVDSNLGSAISDINRVENAIEDLGNSASEAADDGFTILKGAIADISADAITSSFSSLKDMIGDSSSAIGTFQAQTGVATEDLSAFEDVIKEVYTDNFGESMTDVANAMAKISQTTGEIDPSKLKEMAENAYTLQDTFDMDMSETIRGVNALMTHFGLTSKQAFDLMASGAQNGLNFSDELGDNVSEYSGKFAEAGYSADEYFQLLQNGSSGGAYNLDKVNDAINEVTTRMTDGTIADSMSMIDEKTGEVVAGTGGWSSETEALFKAWKDGGATQKEVIASMVGDIQSTTNEQDKMNKAALAFGTMAEDGGTIFIESLSEVGDSFSDVSGKAQEIADIQYGDLGSQLATLGRQIQDEILTPIVSDLEPGLSSFLTFVSDNLDTIIPLVTSLGVALAAVFVVNKIATFVTSIQTIVGIVKGWTAAQTLLNAVMNANPIFLIVVAVGALIAIFAVLWTNCEGFRNFWIGLWDGIKSVASSAWEGIKAIFSVVGEFFQGIWDGVVAIFQGIFDFFVNNWQGILLFILNPFAGAFKLIYDNCEGFREFINGLIESIVGFFTSLWTSLTTIATNIWTSVSTIFTNLWTALTTIATSIWTTIQTIFTAIQTTITTIINAIKTVIETVWNAISTFISTIIGTIKTVIETAWTTIQTTVSTVINAIKTVIETVWNAISTTISTVVNSIKTTVLNVFNGLKTGVSTIFNGIKDAVLGVWDAISTGIKTPINAILGFVETFANGVVSGLNMLVDTANNLSFDIPDWVPGIGGDHVGLNIPKLSKVSIPRLADGAVIPPNQRFLAELGDQTKGVNIETPLATMVDAFKTALNSGEYDGTQTIVIPVTIGDEQIDEIVVNANRRNSFRTNGVV